MFICGQWTQDPNAKAFFTPRCVYAPAHMHAIQLNSWRKKIGKFDKNDYDDKFYILFIQSLKIHILIYILSVNYLIIYKLFCIANKCYGLCIISYSETIQPISFLRALRPINIFSDWTDKLQHKHTRLNYRKKYISVVRAQFNSLLHFFYYGFSNCRPFFFNNKV